MSSCVVDSSAVLASLYGEPGAERVEACLPDALMSAVNAAEVVTKLAERGMNADLAMRTLSGLAIEVVAFDIEQAALTGALRPSTRTAGLSLGDRACLALGKLRRLPVMTAERAWTPLAEAIGVEIIQIREVS